MGYYSDITIVVEVKDGEDPRGVYNSFEEWLKERDEADMYDRAEIETHYENMVVIKYDGVKWYDSYSDVQAVMSWVRFISDLVESDINETVCQSLQYAEIGEDYEDVTIHYHGDVDRYISLVRYVEV